MITWSSVARGRLLVRSWSGEEGVVYDTLSGDTHLLEPLALELLQRLAPDVPRSARALLDELGDAVVDDDSASALVAVEQSLESMHRAGLLIASSA